MSQNQKTDFTSGNIIAQLWSVARPMMLTIFFYTLYNIVDTFWVSKLSTEAIAAVSISQIGLMVMMSLSMGISIGSSVLVGMNIGKKDDVEASRVMAQSFVLATIFGIIFTIIALVFKEPILRGTGALGDIFDPALSYFTIVAAGSILLFYLINIMMCFNSEGDTFTATKLFALSTIVNVILDPILIFGKFGFPEMGIEGAAYATLISQFVFISVAMKVLSSPNRKVTFHMKNLSIEKESVKKVFDIGIPAALTQVIAPLGLGILTYMVSIKFLESGATAFSLAYRLELFAYLPAIGFSMAALSLIGQNVGAGNIDRAREIFKKSSFLGMFSGTILGLVLILFGKYIIQIFTTDQIVVNYSLSYLWIVAGTYGFLSVSMIVASALQAMGKSWPGFWFYIIKFFFIAIPLSYIASLYNLDIYYFWGIIALSNILIAIIGYIWSRKKFETL